MSDHRAMKGSEFVRKLKKLGHTKNIDVRIIQRRGKGSHSTLFYGNKFTIICTLKNELKSGTLKEMLKQLNIDEKDWLR